MPNPRNQTVRGSHALNPSFTGTAPQPTTFGVTAASPATLAQLASSPTPGSLLSDAPASTPKSIPTRYGTTPTNNPVPAAPTTTPAPPATIDIDDDEPFDDAAEEDPAGTTYQFPLTGDKLTDASSIATTDDTAGAVSSPWLTAGLITGALLLGWLLWKKFR